MAPGIGGTERKEGSPQTLCPRPILRESATTDEKIKQEKGCNGVAQAPSFWVE
jgi:hypothetical protein